MSEVLQAGQSWDAVGEVFEAFGQSMQAEPAQVARDSRYGFGFEISQELEVIGATEILQELVTCKLVRAVNCP